jgi:hypothetical protein
LGRRSYITKDGERVPKAVRKMDPEARTHPITLSAPSLPSQESNSNPGVATLHPSDPPTQLEPSSSVFQASQ